MTRIARAIAAATTAATTAVTTLSLGAVVMTTLGAAEASQQAPAPVTRPAGVLRTAQTLPAPVAPVTRTGFGVAAGQRAMMPSNGELLGDYGFAPLPFGKGSWDEGTPVRIDTSELSLRNAWLHYNFNEAPIPAHRCRMPEPANQSDAAFTRSAQAYVSCLAEAWRPWYVANKLPVPKLTVQSCALSPKLSECAGEQDFAALATVDQRIVLNENLRWWSAGAAGVEIVMAHEFGHQLQFTISAIPFDVSALYYGTRDHDSNRWLRRTETQVQCLAVATVAKSRGLDYQDVVDVGQVYGSDERHWGQKPIEFWTKQAIKATKAGNCNAMVAANSLLAYP